MPLRIQNLPLQFSGLFAARVKFAMLDSSGNGVIGLSGGLTIRRSKRGETGGVAITRTVTEISATNMPGVYELQLQAADLDTTGAIAFYITGSGADPTLLVGEVWPRNRVPIA